MAAAYSAEGRKHASSVGNIANDGFALSLFQGQTCHDLFEGIVKVDLHLFLEYFVHEKKWFTYEQLNVQTKTIKLKGSDALDKPATMNGNALHGHAVQVWTFLRFIPLYIGNKIEDQDDSV